MIPSTTPPLFLTVLVPRPCPFRIAFNLALSAFARSHELPEGSNCYEKCSYLSASCYYPTAPSSSPLLLPPSPVISTWYLSALCPTAIIKEFPICTWSAAAFGLTTLRQRWIFMSHRHYGAPNARTHTHIYLWDIIRQRRVQPGRVCGMKSEQNVDTM